VLIRDPWLRALSILGCAIATFYLIGLLWQVVEALADIILLFFMAWLVAFVLEPVVGRLEEHRVPRGAGIAVTYLTLLVLFSLGVILLVPALSLQVVEVAHNLPTYVDEATTLSNAIQTTANAWLTNHGSPVLVDLKSALDPQELSRRADALGPPILSNAIGLATGAATLLVQVVIMLILSFYFMIDGARLAETLIMALPLRAQDDARFLVASIHRAFAGFLRGQLMQSLIGGVGTGLLMSLLHIDYALLSSVIAALVLLIPFVGPIIAVVVPVMIALVTDSGSAVFLFLGLLALHQLLFNVLAPRILSQQIGLHPLLVFFSILTGARVAGVWGAIFGVPIVAVAMTMVSFYRAGQEERAARLLEQLPAEDLVSVDVPAPERAGEALISSGKGVSPS
jgi:predicted PurR-regulated permease PerM